MSRSVGLKRDLRLAHSNTYSSYNLFNIKSFCGVNGDSYDRYLIRMLEMGESLNICNQVASKLLINYTTHKHYNYTN
jgi:NADH-quinone oxidoreductase subunit D